MPRVALPPPVGSSMPPFPSEGLEERATAARLTAITLSLLVVGELVFLALDWRLLHSPLVPLMRGLHVLFCAAALIWLRRRRRYPRTKQLLTVFVVAGMLLLPIFWAEEHAMLSTGRPWSPFTGEKLTMLGIAMLVPAELWIGAVGILLCAGEALVFWYAFELDAYPLQVAASEPWITLFHALVALGLLAYRVRQQEQSLEFSRARAETAALERLARVAVAVRDAANTPLQTLEVSSRLLETRHPEARPIADRIARAVDRLRQLTQLLAGYEREEWHQGDESFDSAQRLKSLSKRDDHRRI